MFLVGVYKYFNGIIDIEEERLRYNQMRLEFENLAIEGIKRLDNIYDVNGSLDKLVENIDAQGAQIFRNILSEKIMPMVVELGIYHIDEEMFLTEYYFKLSHNYVFSEAAEKVKDAYYEIVMDKESLDAYRVARRESRARLVGGGFGVSGAAKGMLLAGAGNMVSGGVHRIANGIGSMVSSIKAEGQKSKIYHNPKTKEALSEGLYESIFNLHYAFYNLMKDYVDSFDMKLVTQSDAKKAQAIMNNIENGRVNEGQIPTLLAEVIQLNPYQEEIYEELIDRYGDDETGIGELAELFGYQLDSYKQMKLNQLFKDYNLETRELAIQAKKDFEKYHKYFNVTNSQCMDQILIAINDFDLQLYENEINFNCENSLIEALKEIDKIGSINTAYKLELIEKINTKISEIELAKRTFEDIIYDTEEDAKQAHFEKTELVELYENASKKTEEEILELIQQLQNKNYTTRSATQYLEEKSKDLFQLVSDRKTVEGISYHSFDEADEARLKADRMNKLLVEAGDDISKLLDLRQLEIECDDTELLDAYKNKVERIIKEKVEADKRLINYHANTNNRILKAVQGMLIRVIGGFLFFLVVNATWLKVICFIWIIGVILMFVEEAKSNLQEKNKNQQEVEQAQERLKIASKRL